MSLTTFSFPTQIRFGAGARQALADFAADHEVHRPLLVTDPGLLETDAFRSVSDEMDRVWPGDWQLFSGVHPNPTDADVTAAHAAYREHDADAAVGLGGGSAIDCGKALRIQATYPRLRLAQIRMDRLPHRLLPYCAIPTTAGTGSEVGRSTVITIESLGRKAVLGGPPLMPDLAILDPELTLGLPPQLTAATGMDAMTHAIESFVCPVFHPMCDGIALEAVRLVRDHLPHAVAHGDDLEARGQMLIAAAMGAVAFQKDLGVAHSLAHPLSSEFGVHHGLANAIVLANTIRFNGAAEHDPYLRVAEALRLAPSQTPSIAVADFLDEFNHSIGISKRLRDVGVPQEDLPRLAKLAFEDPCHQTNPRVCTEADLLMLYQQSW